MRLLIAAIVLACVGLRPLLAGDAELLRIKPARGAAFLYEFSNSSTQTMSVMGQDVVNDLGSSARISVVVLDPVLDRTRLQITLSNCTARAASRSDATMGASGLMKDTIINLSHLDGSTIDLVVSNLGNVISADLGTNSASSGFTSSLKLPDRVMTPLPEQSVVPGSTWTSERADTTATAIGTGIVVTNTRMRHTFKGIKDTLGIRCWYIETVSTSLTQSGELQMSEMDVSMDGSGTMIQRTYIEKSNGMTVLVTGEIQTQMQMSIAGQAPMVIPIDTSMRYTVKRSGDKR